MVSPGNILSSRPQLGPRTLYCLKHPKEILMPTHVWGQGVFMQGGALLEYQI